MDKDFHFKDVESFAIFIAVMERYNIAYNVFEEDNGWNVRVLHAKI